jgi:predicted phage terminase large subunit-like protein
MSKQPTARNITDVICQLDFASFTRKAFQTFEPSSEFLPNWHIDAITYRLEQARHGKVKRLIVTLPPRMLKSFICSVAYPAFILGLDPTKRVIVLSYSLELAVKLSNDFRALVNSPWYQSVFSNMRISRMKNTEFEVVTTHNGYRLGGSIDGSVTGRGADIIIIDDPMKPMDALSDSKRQRVIDLYNTTLHTRLDNKQAGVILLVMQRLHTDDPAGTLQRSAGGWTTLSLPAIAEQEETIQISDKRYHHRMIGDVIHPEREPKSALDLTRSMIGSETFAAQYQQAPIPPGGVMIQRQWVRRYDRLPDRTSSSLVIQSWDTASRDGGLNDYSVCTTWLLDEGRYYLMHVLRKRLDYPSLKTQAIAHARAYNPNKILIEDSGSSVGTALVGELKKAGLVAIGVKPERSKKTRMSIQSSKFEEGLVFFPEQAPWLDDYEAEVFAFPHVRFDDQVDSTSQALALDHSAFDVNAFADGMARLSSGLAFGQLFRGRVV